MSYEGGMKISVIVPAYNEESYIAKALDSIFTQSYPATEVIVVDDGSTDRTRKIAENLGAKVILLEHSGSIGLVRRRGVEAASGDFIAFLSADDAWRTRFLERVSWFWQTRSVGHPKLVVYSDWYLCDKNLKLGKVRKCPKFTAHAAVSYAVHPAPNMFVMWDTVFMPRTIFDDVMFDAKACVGEDLIFLLESILRGWSYHLLSEPLVKYRVHEGQRTGQWTSEEGRYLRRRVKHLTRQIQEKDIDT